MPETDWWEKKDFDKLPTKEICPWDPKFAKEAFLKIWLEI